MSYARFSDDSSVYVFSAVDGHLECCACSLGADWAIGNTDAMVAHLHEHEAAGHRVPPRVFEGLERDRVENDAYIAHVKAGGTFETFSWAAS